MIMNATITLTEAQLREILTNYLQKEEGIIGIGPADLFFNVEYVKTGPAQDAVGTHKLTGVTVKNVRVGRPSDIRD